MTETTQPKISADEFLESLTGFDEIAVDKAFGREVMTLAQDSPTTFLRALVFIAKKREGFNDKDAKTQVLGMSLRQVQDQFADDAEEPMPEEPITESGKDDAEHG